MKKAVKITGIISLILIITVVFPVMAVNIDSRISREKEWIKGDVNNDGSVTICDCVMIQRILTHSISEPDKKTRIRGSVVNNGQLDTADAAHIQLFLSGKNSGLGIGDKETAEKAEEISENEYRVIYSETVVKQSEEGRISKSTADNAESSKHSATETNNKKHTGASEIKEMKTEPYADKEYTVTFKDFDESIISVQKVIRGSAAVEPEKPERQGYVFTGWDFSFENVCADLTVKPIYKKLNDTPYIIVSNVNACPGDSCVAVTVSVVNNPGFSVAEMDVIYDRSKLKLNSISYNTEAYQNASVVPLDPSSFIGRISITDNTGNINGDITLATLYFDVFEDTADDAQISVMYDPSNIHNIIWENVEFEIINGLINL